jgi:hypothetical protein
MNQRHQNRQKLNSCSSNRLFNSFVLFLFDNTHTPTLKHVHRCMHVYYSEFSEKELEDLLDSEEEGDAWVSLEVPAHFCLNPDFDRGDAWSILRNAVQQLNVEGKLDG